MAFKSENDPDLLIDPDSWGKGFRNCRYDPAIHIFESEIVYSSSGAFDDFRSLANKRKQIEDDDSEPCEPSLWEKSAEETKKKYVRDFKMTAQVARDAIFNGAGLSDVYRLVAEMFQYEAKALLASVKAK